MTDASDHKRIETLLRNNAKDMRALVDLLDARLKWMLPQAALEELERWTGKMRFQAGLAEAEADHLVASAD